MEIEETIPKISSNKFLFENWNSEFCVNFYNMYENKEFIKDINSEEFYEAHLHFQCFPFF